MASEGTACTSFCLETRPLGGLGMRPWAVSTTLNASQGVREASEAGPQRPPFRQRGEEKCGEEAWHTEGGEWETGAGGWNAVPGIWSLGWVCRACDGIGFLSDGRGFLSAL